jgi:hypothetical protein
LHELSRPGAALRLAPTDVDPQAIAELDDTFVDLRLDLLEEDDHEYYACYELVLEPLVRVPEHDVIDTLDFVREPLDAHDPDNVETTDFVREPLDPRAIVVAQYSVPFERTPFEQVTRSAEGASTAAPAAGSHPIIVIAVLVGALALGIGVALLAI